MRRIVTLSIVILLLAGCTQRRPNGLLFGTVTYKGNPVNGAALFLYPANEGGKGEFLIPVSQEGDFRTSDVPLGDYKVVVQGTAGQAGPSLEGIAPDKLAEAKEKIEAQRTPATIPFPNKYKSFKTTPLTITVQDGKKELKVELTD
jgi:hypothetical protein